MTTTTSAPESLGANLFAAVAERIGRAAAPGGPLDADLVDAAREVASPDDVAETDPLVLEVIALKRLDAVFGGFVEVVLQTDSNTINFVRLRIDSALLKVLLRRRAFCEAEDHHKDDDGADPVFIGDDREPTSAWFSTGASSSDWMLCVNAGDLYFFCTLGDRKSVRTQSFSLGFLVDILAGMSCSEAHPDNDSEMWLRGNAILCADIMTMDHFARSVMKNCHDLVAMETAALLRARIVDPKAKREINQYGKLQPPAPAASAGLQRSKRTRGRLGMI